MKFHKVFNVFCICRALAIGAVLCWASTSLADTVESPEHKIVRKLAEGKNLVDDYHTRIGRIAGRFDTSRLDESRTFTAPIARLLLMAGHNLETVHDKPHYETTARMEDEFYHSSFLWKMRREFRQKAVRRIHVYKESMESIYERLEKMIVTKQKAKREHLKDHI
jgi:hypothetical protein